MKLPRSWTLTFIIASAVVLWMLSGNVSDKDKHVTEVEQTATAKRLSVRVQHSVAEAMTDRFILQGHTLAKRKVTLKAETSGTVKKILVKRGELVKSGHELIQLAVDIRDARLIEARSLLQEREAQLSAAQSLKREGFQAEIEIAKAKAALDSAKAVLSFAEIELQRTLIKAPITGIINSRLVEVGDYVSQGDPMAVIVDLNPIRVVGQVSERYIGQIREGKTGEVRLLDNTIVKSTVTYVGAVANENTRTFPVEMEIPNVSGQIIEGITAELHLPIKQIMAHKIPSSALSLLDDGTLSVKTVDSESRVVALPVQMLGETNEGIWLGGLPQKLSIVTVGHEFVKPGEQVIAVDQQGNTK